MDVCVDTEAAPTDDGGRPIFTVLASCEIAVPDDYRHGECLKNFRINNGREFSQFDQNITDLNFLRPSTVLLSRQRYAVTAWRIKSATDIDTCIRFARSRGGSLTGAQGLALVWEVARGKFLAGYRYVSPDRRESLWQGTDGVGRVPALTLNTRETNPQFTLESYDSPRLLKDPADLMLSGCALLVFELKT